MKYFQIFALSFCFCMMTIMGGLGLSYANDQVTFTTDVRDPIEILFQVGLDEARKGNYPSSIKIFKALARESTSPRIQLELARVLFLDRRYQESGQVFETLLKQPELPWAVQENIRAYLEAIDAAQGYIKFGFSLIKDDNPKNFTDSQEIRIAGQTLRIVPPEDNKEIWGARYTIKGARVLTKNGALTGYVNTSYTDFPSSLFDRWIADVGLFLSFRSLPKIKLRAGLEESYYGGYHLYSFPYVGFIYIPDPVMQFRSRSELKVGQLRVPNATYLDATSLSLTTMTNRPLNEDVDVSGDFYLEKTFTEEKPYSYYGGALGLSISFALFGDWGIRPYASIGRRFYEDEDPFFGEERQETRITAGITAHKDSFRLFGFIPEFEWRYDENRSNIEYYSYDKLVLQLNFKQ